MVHRDALENRAGGRTKVTVRVPLGTRLALTSVMERQQACGRRLLTHDKDRLGNEELLALRGGGELLDKRGTLVVFGLRQEVAVRGWDRSWQGVDIGEIPPGLLPDGTSFPEALSLWLPTALVEQVSAGCWTVSEDCVRRLRQWRDSHTVTVLRSHSVVPQEHATAAEYCHLAAGITEPDEVYRAGIMRGLHAALHGVKLPLQTMASASAPR
ncbi:hypothetical protein ABZ341_35300 [Streptomyces sp. NPDC006173]|uniref:hypothetical protein n=1 Tax=Streptomyces sp. NPDC006173 TaxID=3155349 RepID=UPI0033FA402A